VALVLALVLLELLLSRESSKTRLESAQPPFTPLRAMLSWPLPPGRGALPIMRSGLDLAPGETAEPAAGEGRGSKKDGWG
jgi:hypothetical protein